MRVLLVHNAYQQRGGEDSVVEAEKELLARHGHAVDVYTRHNDEIATLGRLAAARDAVWSAQTVREIGGRLREFSPDVIHVHNTFPLISPSLYHAADRARVPVVQTLHNFRLLCPQAMFLRDGRVCEDCLGRLPWRAVVHGCYHQSSAQTAVVAGMLGIHRALGTYRTGITRYIALNRFCRDKFVEAGIAADQISIKPNFVDLPAPDPSLQRSGAMFVGRLSKEKGTRVLAGAAAAHKGARVDVVGAGPEQGFLEGVPALRVLGWQPSKTVYDLMQRALYLVVPSICYETFGLILIEAFACGTPVIASDLGSLAETVRDGETGLLFQPGVAADLARKMAWADEHPHEMRRMGEVARREYEARYTPDVNMVQLTKIYKHAVEARH